MAQTRTVHTLERARDAFADIRQALETKLDNSLDEVPVERYDDIIENMPDEPRLDTLTVTPSTNEQTIVPEQGYDGFNEVTVDAVELQSKTVTPSTSQQVVTPDSGYLGLSQVTVDAVELQSKTVTPSTSQQVVTPDSGYLGLSQVTVDAVINNNIGYSTPKNKEAGYVKDYRKITTITSGDNRISILFKGVVHVFNDDVHWTFDDETDTLINQETVSELSGNMDWHRMPVIDDSGDYMYLLAKPNWSGFSQLVKYDGTTFTAIGNKDLPAGGIIYDNGYILIDRGSTYIKVDVTDGTHAEYPKDESLSFRYAFKYNGKFYTSNATSYIYEMDLANNTKTQLLELPGTQLKNQFFVDENTGWIYTIQGPQNNETLVRFKVTGEIETIGTSYVIGNNYGGQLICTFILNDVIYVLWYNMEQVATKGSAKTVIVVPTSATRIYNGCTSEDVNETISGDYSILEIPAEANYMIYDSHNIYGYNVVSNKILVASGMKINGTAQSAGLIDVSSLSYYLVEV